MSSYNNELDWSDIQIHILQLEQEGKVTRTFRRLDPERQKIVIDAILEEASEKGPTSINIKEVARRAEVSIGSLYQYFGNREGLLDFAVALCVRYTINLFEQFGPVLSTLPIREALRYYILGGIEWGQTEASLVRFLGRAAYQGDPEMTESVVRPVADVMLALMREILTQASERGELRPDLDLDATARAVNALMIAVGDSQLLPYLNNYFRVSDENMPLERVVDALVEMLLHGLAR
jgi:TetR/AcrR family transcriptional regulator